jgi:hypothetical protein
MRRRSATGPARHSALPFTNSLDLWSLVVIGASHGIASGLLAERSAALIAVAVSAGYSMKKK